VNIGTLSNTVRLTSHKNSYFCAMHLSIVIPIYNEEANISALYERLSGVAKSINPAYELLFVNDGSKDASILLIKQLAMQDSHIRYLDLSRNFGHQIAVSAGLDRCVGEYIAIIDADLQDPPELITDMYKKMQEGYEVVYAKRRSREGETFLKKFTARQFYRMLASITSVEIPVDTGDFRLMSHKIVEVLRQMPEQHKFLRGQISWVGFNQTYVEYDRSERNAGETGYTYKKMIRFALDGITSFSRFPLKVATISGFVVSGFSFLMIIYALYSKFFLKDTIQGWTSLMLAITFIGGIQLISLGIMGEYIGRLSDNVRKRPLYIIKDSNIE
jgi:dolichol-phosphate mannosyltransferase